jgi:hypothetical protein
MAHNRQNPRVIAELKELAPDGPLVWVLVEMLFKEHFGILIHGAQLQHCQRVAITALPLLAENWRASINQLNSHCGDHHERQESHQ